MAVYSFWSLQVIVVAVLGLSSATQSLDIEETDEGLISYAELLERQKIEFVDALQYENIVAEDVRDLEPVIHEAGDGLQEAVAKSDSQTDGDRNRRAAGTDIYSGLAGISGGSVITIDKKNLSSALGVISSATLKSPVLISRTTIHSQGTGLNTGFNVDSSVSTIDIQIQMSCCKANIVVYHAKSRVVPSSNPNVKVLSNTRTLFEVQITSPATGRWSLSVFDTHKQVYTVFVRGSSLINFNAAFSDRYGTESTELPVPNSNATYVKVDPLGYDLANNWTNFVIMATDSKVLQRVPLKNLRGSHGYRAFLIPVVWPDQDVYIGIDGIDKSGQPFTRVQATPVTPVGLRITLDNPELEFLSTCDPIAIPFTVRNVGTSTSVTLSVFTTNSKFKAAVARSKVTIGTKLSVHINVTLSILDKTIGSGETVTVTLFANAHDGRAQQGDIDLLTKGPICHSVSTVQYETSSFTSQSSTPNGSASTAFRKNNLFTFFIILLAFQLFA